MCLTYKAGCVPRPVLSIYNNKILHLAKFEPRIVQSLP